MVSKSVRLRSARNTVTLGSVCYGEEDVLRPLCYAAECG